jgi:uncharacterized protein YbjT (DUF2867 family)
MSRHAAAGTPPPGTEWAVADLAAGTGLDSAVEGVDGVIHAASDPRGDPRATDVEGTARLLSAARGAGTGHFIYVSIVGIDRVPFPYYRAKLECEERVRSAGVPWTIVRGTQWHDFVESLLLPLARVPWVMPVPAGWRLQPSDAGEFAGRLVQAAGEGPQEETVDFAGPEVRTLGGLARSWLEVRGMRRHVVGLPAPGGLSAAMRRGLLTLPPRHDGRITWEHWLRTRYGAPDPARLPDRVAIRPGA